MNCGIRRQIGICPFGMFPAKVTERFSHSAQSMNLEYSSTATSETERASISGERQSIASYWQEQYRNEPYYNRQFDFRDYLPAYLLGSENYRPESSFEAAEDQLSHLWTEARGHSRLRWSQARNAARAGWYKTKRTRKAYAPIWST